MDANGVQNSFLWENQECAFINSDYSGGGNVEKSSQKVSDSNVFNNSSPPLITVDVTPSMSGKRIVSLENNNGGDNRGNEEKRGGDNRERANHGHVWIERERRKKMKNMFTILQDLLPQLPPFPPKVDKLIILDETVKHIKTLETILNDLQKQKVERLEIMKSGTNLGMDEMTRREVVLAPPVFKTWTSPNLVLNVCGFDAHINIYCPAKFGLLSTICFVLEKYKIDVLSAHVSSDHNKSMYMIHACVASGYECQFPVEEIYKQAATEIITICQ